jgi:hypothetical protein
MKRERGRPIGRRSKRKLLLERGRSGWGVMQNGNHTHQSLSTVEREKAVRRRSSVVGRKDEGSKQ